MTKEIENIDDELTGEDEVAKDESEVVEEAGKKEGAEDERVVQSGDDDEDHPDVNADGLSDEERTARNRIWREQRKQRRKEREESHRRELDSLRTQNSQLASRLEQVERRNTGADEAVLEQELEKTARSYQFFKEQIAEQTQAQNGAGVAEATEKMIAAQMRFNQLQGIKTSVSQQKQSPQPLDPRLAAHATAWMTNNTWYDPTGKDPDSRRVLNEDNILAGEGWDPTTPEYWQELSTRVGKLLPHRAKMEHNRSNGGEGANKRRSGVAGSGSSTDTSANRKGSFQLSPERVQAIKDAGMWDDAAQRNKMIKRYQAHDAANQ